MSKRGLRMEIGQEAKRENSTFLGRFESWIRRVFEEGSFLLFVLILKKYIIQSIIIFNYD